MLERYPITSNLDVTYADGFVSVGLSNYLGTYYVFMEGGYSKLERDESVGYYVWRDGEGLSYMKQNLAFEFVSSGIDTFVSAYKSPDQFYMDFGKIVSADGGKLAITQTSWTVQDYFMSDSFVMAEERDEYAYDSVEAFVSDYIAGQLGESDFESEEETDEPAREEPPTAPPNFGFSADNIDLVFAVNRLKDKIDYGSQIEDLREHMSLLAVNSESEAHKAMRIGSKSELDEFLKTVKEIAPLCFDECSF